MLGAVRTRQESAPFHGALRNPLSAVPVLVSLGVALLSAEELGPLGAVVPLHPGPDRPGGVLDPLPHPPLVETTLGHVHHLPHPPRLRNAPVAPWRLDPLPLDLSTGAAEAGPVRRRLVDHPLPGRPPPVVLRPPPAAEPPVLPLPALGPAGQLQPVVAAAGGPAVLEGHSKDTRLTTTCTWGWRVSLCATTKACRSSTPRA